MKLRSRFGALWNRPSRSRRKFLTFLQEIQSLLRHDIHLVMDRPGTVVSPGTCRPLVSAVAQLSCKTSGWRTPTAFTAQVSDVLVIKFGGPIDGFLLSELPRAMASFAPVIGRRTLISACLWSRWLRYDQADRSTASSDAVNSLAATAYCSVP